MAPRILLIEDDGVIRHRAIEVFGDHGLEARGVDSLEGAREWISHSDLELIILDLVLPDGSGLELLREIRTNVRADHLQVIVLSGLADEADRVLALEMGADDYMTKPFSARELVARARTALRRHVAPGPSPSVLVAGPLEIDETAFEVRFDAEPVDLRKKEFDLLAFLAANPKQVFSKRQLLAEVWDADPAWLSESTVTEHVRRVRLKFPVPVIETVWGVGYRLNPGLSS